jgi:hypothetical protein
VRRALAAAAILALAATAADAQLYRWRDPQSGSVKLSSIPPPWYGRGVSNRPHVELIMQGKAVDPMARPGTGEAGTGGGPLPAPRMLPQPPDATRAQLVAAVAGGLRLREQFEGWLPSVSEALERGADGARLAEPAREALRNVARAAFRADRLEAHFLKAFSAEVADDDLRAVIEIEQTPLARRVAAIEGARSRRLATDPQQVAAAEARAGPERRAIAEAIERAVQGADLMAAGLAGAAAAIALASPEEARGRVGDLLQKSRAEAEPLLRRAFVGAVLFLYEPLTDAELRELLALQKRPEVARLNRAIGLGYAATVQESLSEFLAGVQPIVAAARR